MSRFRFTPPVRGLGAVSFADWLKTQSADVQNSVTDYQAENPSDYVPYSMIGSGSGLGFPNWMLAAGVGLVALVLIKAGK